MTKPSPPPPDPQAPPPLLPCPFCGSSGSNVSPHGINAGESNWYWYECGVCHSTGGNVKDDESLSAAAWNRRRTPEPPAAAAPFAYDVDTYQPIKQPSATTPAPSATSREESLAKLRAICDDLSNDNFNEVLIYADYLRMKRR